MPRNLRTPIVLVVAAGALLAGAPVRAQDATGPAGRTVLAPGDTARILRAARSEQSRFERIRRSGLPWAWGGGGGSCDERIGRFCLTYGDDSPDWVAPPEPEETTAARDRLLGHLAEASARLPSNGWLVGQRIRYLVEARRLAEARGVAAGCTAAIWWCGALSGFALHNAGDPGPAHAAFSRALASMPEEIRRQWTDLSHVLEPEVYRAYRRLDPAGREAFAERFWALGDPFYMRPGNELRSEHLSRNVWDFLQDRARNTENLSWGSDLREILVRYGWPSGWERVRERWGSLAGPSMLSHYSNGDRNLVPPPEVLRDGEIWEGTWDVESARARTAYSVPLPDSAVRWLDTLDHQLAVFRRGDSARVVMAYELPADSFPSETAIDAGLAVAASLAEPPHTVRFPLGGRSDRLTVDALPGQLLLSLEVLSVPDRRAARSRYGLRIPPMPPGLIAVSDLLLLRSPDALPDSLADAVAQARPSTRVRPGERIGVYWEVYGLSADAPRAATMSLRLLDPRGGWLRGLAERVGLVSGDDPIRLRWQELPAAAPQAARALAIQIPDVAPGDYTLELSVALPGREALTVERTLRVR